MSPRGCRLAPVWWGPCVSVSLPGPSQPLSGLVGRWAEAQGQCEVGVSLFPCSHRGGADESQLGGGPGAGTDCLWHPHTPVLCSGCHQHRSIEHWPCACSRHKPRPALSSCPPRSSCCLSMPTDPEVGATAPEEAASWGAQPLSENHFLPSELSKPCTK